MRRMDDDIREIKDTLHRIEDGQGREPDPTEHFTGLMAGLGSLLWPLRRRLPDETNLVIDLFAGFLFFIGTVPVLMGIFYPSPLHTTSSKAAGHFMVLFI
jgi:hypothetical protein